jgi:hypothetical protein
VGGDEGEEVGGEERAVARRARPRWVGEGEVDWRMPLPTRDCPEEANEGDECGREEREERAEREWAEGRGWAVGGWVGGREETRWRCALLVTTVRCLGSSSLSLRSSTGDALCSAVGGERAGRCDRSTVGGVGVGTALTPRPPLPEVALAGSGVVRVVDGTAVVAAVVVATASIGIGVAAAVAVVAAAVLLLADVVFVAVVLVRAPVGEVGALTLEASTEVGTDVAGQVPAEVAEEVSSVVAEEAADGEVAERG